MLRTETHRYGHTIELPDTSLDTGRQRLELALKDEGFTVLSEINLQEMAVKRCSDWRQRPYCILLVWPDWVSRSALTGDRHFGYLLPCHIVLREDSTGRLLISAADPRTLFVGASTPELDDFVAQLEHRIERSMEVVKLGGRP